MIWIRFLDGETKRVICAERLSFSNVDNIICVRSKNCDIAIKRLIGELELCDFNIDENIDAIIAQQNKTQGRW